MPRQSNSITRSECQSTHATLMEKIDKLTEVVNKLAVDFASLPGELIKELDQRYANKTTETEVKEIKTKMDARTYEWFKYLATLIIGAAFAYLWFVKK